MTTFPEALPNKQQQRQLDRIPYQGKTNQELVREFMETFDHETPAEFMVPSEDTINLRRKLMEEEHLELLEEMKGRDKEKIAKELTDLLVVVYGTAIAYGIDADACMKEVHRSNMSKLGEDGKPLYREDGKVLKGPNFSPADLSDIV